MKFQKIFQILSCFLMAFSSCYLYGQGFTFNHDPSVMNQFTVGEVGLGALTPSTYYDLLHQTYRTTAMVTGKQLFRTHLQLALTQQEPYAEHLDSALHDRKRVELKNIADRTPGVSDLAWQFERGKIEGKLNILKKNIERITIEGGTVQSYREWLERYNAIQCGLDAVRDAYMPQGSRKEQYLAIYKDILNKTVEVCNYVDFLRTEKLVKSYTSNNQGATTPIDTSQVKRIAIASHGRWKIALAAVSGSSSSE